MSRQVVVLFCDSLFRRQRPARGWYNAWHLKSSGGVKRFEPSVTPRRGMCTYDVPPDCEVAQFVFGGLGVTSELLGWAVERVLAFVKSHDLPVIKILVCLGVNDLRSIFCSFSLCLYFSPFVCFHLFHLSVRKLQ